MAVWDVEVVVGYYAGSAGNEAENGGEPCCGSREAHIG